MIFSHKFWVLFLPVLHKYLSVGRAPIRIVSAVAIFICAQDILFYDGEILKLILKLSLNTVFIIFILTLDFTLFLFYVNRG